MPCVLIGLLLAGLAAYVVSGLITRISVGPDGAHGNAVRAVSFLVAFVSICLMVVIFVSKLRFSR